MRRRGREIMRERKRARKRERRRERERVKPNIIGWVGMCKV